MDKIIEIYTDGACRGNPGPGGWAALLRFQDHEKILSGACLQTTNNQMELTAAIESLKALSRPSLVVLYTDSKYVQQGITTWIKAWRQKGWKNASGELVKNQVLWKTLDIVSKQHQIEWQWVKGHAHNPNNERVDALAKAAIDDLYSGHQ